MNVLHLEYAGNTGGIEKLCRDIGANTIEDKHYFVFVHEGGSFYEQMKNDGLNVRCLYLENRNILKLYIEIIKLVDKEKKDAIIIHHPAPLVWISTLLYLYLSHKAKVVVYAHNVYEGITKHNRIKRIIYNILLKKCDGVIAISEFVKRTIAENSSIENEKIKVIYNGVKTLNEMPVVNGTLNSPVKIIYVGRLIKQKGVQVLLEAIELLKDKVVCELEIIGDGPYRSDLENIASELGVYNKVRFCGNQSNVQEWLKKADIFVHPTIGDEGFGLTIVEAMNCGKICIASYKGGIPEIVTDGQDGFLVAAERPKDIAEKIDYVCNNFTVEKRLSIQKKAIGRAQDFSIENLVYQLRNYIYSL